jgi:hypothetical protein
VKTAETGYMARRLMKVSFVNIGPLLFISSNVFIDSIYFLYSLFYE